MLPPGGSSLALKLATVGKQMQGMGANLVTICMIVLLFHNERHVLAGVRAKLGKTVLNNFPLPLVNGSFKVETIY